MIYRKLAIVGDVGTGKSTFVRTVSEITPIDTDRVSTVDIGKEMTTVGIDYGRLMLSPEHALGLYGLPGQQRFSALWRTVQKGLWGLIVLTRYTRSGSIGELKTVMDFFLGRSPDLPFVVGITHADSTDDDRLDAFAGEVRGVLSRADLISPVITIDCRDRSSALSALSLLNALAGADA